MRHTFTREQIKRIIVEELEKSKIADAAEEIVDELESMLTEADESALRKIYNKIFAKSKEENIDADKLAVQTWKASQTRRRAKSFLAGMTLAAFLGGLQAAQDAQGEAAAQAASAERTTQAALSNIEQQRPADAVEKLDGKLSVSNNFVWTLSPEDQPKTMDDMIAAMEPGQGGGQSKLQNYPIFQDYNLGTVEMLSQEYGVVLKLKNDIQKQIEAGVKNKKDLKPMIDLSTVRDPDRSVEEFAKIYKQIYDIPEFDPSKVDEEDIGGNADQVRKRTGGGIQFIKFGRGRSMGFETYPLLDLVNPELPNEKMSASQYYVKLFNEVTGQNIEP
jgi:hypothetical protein